MKRESTKITSLPILTKKEQKKANNLPLILSKVVSPAIPAFIGAGLLSGVSNLISYFGDPNSMAVQAWSQFFKLLLTILSNVFIIIIGWNIGAKFGKQPILTALIAAIFCDFVALSLGQMFPHEDGYYQFLSWSIPEDQIQNNWFTKGLVKQDGDNFVLGAPRAGLIGAIMAVVCLVYLEKLFDHLFKKGVFKGIIQPPLLLLITFSLIFIIIIPLGFYFFQGLTWLFFHIYRNPFGAALLGGTYLLAVMVGVHQGFFPIYMAIFSIEGLNSLFPIMIMAAASQVGVGLALLLLAKGQLELRKQIISALIPAFFGITEPLTYGVTLPRGKPLYIACVGGFIGGFLIGSLNAWWGVELGITAPISPGGLTALLLVTTRTQQTGLAMIIYLLLLLVMYGVGFCFGLLGYTAQFRFASSQSAAIYTFKKATLQSNNELSKFKLFWKSFVLNCWRFSGALWFWNAFYNYPKLNEEEKKALKAFVIT